MIPPEGLLFASRACVCANVAPGQLAHPSQSSPHAGGEVRHLRRVRVNISLETASWRRRLRFRFRPSESADEDSSPVRT